MHLCKTQKSGRLCNSGWTVELVLLECMLYKMDGENNWKYNNKAFSQHTSIHFMKKPKSDNMVEVSIVYKQNCEFRQIKFHTQIFTRSYVLILIPSFTLLARLAVGH